MIGYHLLVWLYLENYFSLEIIANLPEIYDLSWSTFFVIYVSFALAFGLHLFATHKGTRFMLRHV